MYGPVRTVVWADGRGDPASDPIVLCERFEIRFSLFDFGIQGDHLFEQIVVQVSHGGRDILLRKNGANAWFNRTCTQGYKEADFA